MRWKRTCICLIFLSLYIGNKFTVVHMHFCCCNLHFISSLGTAIILSITPFPLSQSLHYILQCKRWLQFKTRCMINAINPKTANSDWRDSTCHFYLHCLILLLKVSNIHNNTHHYPSQKAVAQEKAIHWRVPSHSLQQRKRKVRGGKTQNKAFQWSEKRWRFAKTQSTTEVHCLRRVHTELSSSRKRPWDLSHLSCCGFIVPFSIEPSQKAG